MWDVTEYAIHTHYTQFFWNINWNFKQVTWTWNQFIFPFWKLLFWTEIFYFDFEYFYFNMQIHISILKNYI